MRLLYHMPYVNGGMADYAFNQVAALAEAGAEVTLLCADSREGPWWQLAQNARPYTLLPRLRGVRPRPALPRPVRQALYAADIVRDGWTVAAETHRGGFTRVLFGVYYEYIAPLWAPPLRRLAAGGKVVFGSVVHDPARDHVVGPRWWHRYSTACGYSFLRDAFVHAPITLDTVRPMPRLRTTVIPQGLYEFPAATRGRGAVRAALDLPTDAPVLLSFGHIRDGKNLDLVLQALADFPDVYLLVAGKEQSGGQKPASFYQQKAVELGVADRCRWVNRFVAEDEIGEFFAAADLLLLTYSARFRSASAVLNVASTYRLPCLASGGDGALRDAVQAYGLGLWIDPDSADDIRAGLRRWQAGQSPTARWDDYAADNSWRRNAEIVLQTLRAP